MTDRLPDHHWPIGPICWFDEPPSLLLSELLTREEVKRQIEALQEEVGDFRQQVQHVPFDPTEGEGAIGLGGARS